MACDGGADADVWPAKTSKKEDSVPQPMVQDDYDIVAEAVESLYADGIRPEAAKLIRCIKAQVGEACREGSWDYDRIRKACERETGDLKVNEEERGQNRGQKFTVAKKSEHGFSFVDPAAWHHDPHDKEYSAMKQFLESPSQGWASQKFTSNYDLATYLHEQKPLEFSKLRCGVLLQLVHRALDEKFLGHQQERDGARKHSWLVLYQFSMEKEQRDRKLAASCEKCVESVGQLKNMLLKLLLAQERGILLCKLPTLIREQCGKELNEALLGYPKLKKLLQDPDLMNWFRLEGQGTGDKLVLLERNTRILQSRQSFPIRNTFIHFAPSPCFVRACSCFF